MPHKSLREIRKELRRLHSTDRYVDALLVVESHVGEELFRVGGRWDNLARRYVAGDCKPLVIKLKESQLEVARAFSRWLTSSRHGAVDALRIILLILAGARGSGKTWFVGLMIVAIGLEWRDEWQYSVNLSTGQRREIIEAITECSRPDWIADRSDDLRDPWLKFVTGSTVAFVSARNPRRLREAKLRIRAVHINEAQDQEEEVYVNAISATRNVDGLTTLATNRPQHEGGDWVSVAASGVEAGEIVGELYLLDPRKNNAVSKVALEKRANAIRVVNAEAAAADTDPDAPMLISGKLVYPAFSPLPFDKGGHVGEPPQLGWTDVTIEATAAVLGGGVGFPFLCGVDFQRVPGVIGDLAKLYRTPERKIVLYVFDQVGVRGVELAFSQALYAAGYRPTHGMGGAPVLLIGDGTGDRQNANHNWAQPTSFSALQSDGWKIIGPDRHWKHGIPWNPPVRLSRTQMHMLLEAHQILIAPKCKEPVEGFPSLVESFRRAPASPKGGLVEKGNFQHGCDPVRYLAWRFLPRPTAPKAEPTFDKETFETLAAIKLLSS
jgi:hypothetical protein